MIEHTVQNDPDPVLMKSLADLPEVLVGPQSLIQALVVPRIISVRVRGKKRAEINRVNAQLLHVRDPVQNLFDPVQRNLLFAPLFIGKRRSAKAKCIYLIKNALFSPHKSPP